MEAGGLVLLFFNLNDDVCFEIGNALRRFIFLGGSVQPALSNCGLSPHILRLWLMIAQVVFHTVIDL